MRTMIIGAGSAGKHLATTLCNEKHDVVLVDKNPNGLAEAEAQLDILTVEGDGANPRVLDDAGISKCNLLVAVTSSEDKNILACALAKMAGVSNTVARVTSADHSHPPEWSDLKKIGIDLIVHQKESCAREVFNMLRLPGATEAVELFHGQVFVVGFKLGMTSPLLRGTLKEYSEPEHLKNIRFVARLRGQDLEIPRGDTDFLIGDEVYIAGQPQDIRSFLQYMSHDVMNFTKICIAGGGDMGFHLANHFEKGDHEIVIVEQDPTRASRLSERLDHALVLKGDALDKEVLNDMGIHDTTAFVATTGSDENNIISCLIAEKIGACFTVAKITKPEYVPIINSLSLLDRAVNPYISMTNSILHFLRGHNVQSATLLHNLPGELLEIELQADSKWTGSTIEKLKLPKDSVIASLLRGHEILTPTGDLKLEERDRMVLFTKPGAIHKVQAFCNK